MPVKIPYPYHELRFDANGKPADAKQLTALIAGLKANKTTDLFIVSHGWNNDQKEAHALYQELFTNVKKAEKHLDVTGRSFAVAGVIWPSKKFDAAEDKPNAASLGKGTARVKKQLDTLASIVAGQGGAAATKSTKQITRAKELLPKLEKDPKAQAEFSSILMQFLPSSVSEEGDLHIDQRVAARMIADGEFLEQLGARPRKVTTRVAGTGGISAMGGGPRTTDSGATYQGAAGLGDFLKGIVAGASNLLNYVTYYQMKERAATVGRAGVNEALAKVRAELPGVRVHLVGHSFGCRVVTAAVTGKAANAAGFAQSVSLLQGAFSHYAFSPKYDKSNKPGLFRNLVTESRVSGPMIITHTRADKAVGQAYAIASRAARQIAAALGDKNDPYGGLGSNGAQLTPEASQIPMPKAGSAFAAPLTKGSMTNLLADGLITSHGDVANQHAAYAVLSAACAT